MNDVTTVFETTRLLAVEWDHQLAEQAFEIYGDPEVTKFISGAETDSVETMHQRIDEIIARNSQFQSGMGSFPMLLKSTGTMVGTALIKPLPLSEGNFADEIEIGWHLARRQWGRGYATEWGKKLIEIGFQEFGLQQLNAVIDPPNEKSKKVAVRLGMKHIGLTSDYYEGKSIEHYVMTRDS